MWTLVCASMDGITFFAPLLIRRILDGDTPSTSAMGDAFQLPSWP